MSVTSGFFNSLNGDRKYNADQMSALFDNLITDGVFSNVGTAFAVKADAGNSVTVGIGRAWFNSTWLYNSALLPITLESSEVFLDRIDAIVIEIDRTDAVRKGTIRVVKGLPGSKPSNPSLTDEGDLHQHPLAYIYRKAGSSSISQADITNTIGTSSCPYVTGILQTQNIDTIVAQWEAEFDEFLGSLEDVLEGDVAANLASRILQLENKFQTLEKEKTIYGDILDSNGEAIRDSGELSIVGRTMFDSQNSENKALHDQPKSDSDGLKIGDLLTTVRTDLDAKWLYCNGASKKRILYPALSNLFPMSPNGNWASNGSPIAASENSTDGGLNKVIYANGYYITSGISHVSSSKQIPIVCYKMIGSSWKAVNLKESASNETYGPLYVAYGKGYYVAATRVYNSSTRKYNVRIFYSNSLDGPWQYNDTSPGGTTYTVSDVYDISYIEESESFAIGLSAYSGLNYAIVMYTTSPQYSTWSYKELWSSNSGYTSACYAVRYLNGKYFFLGCQGNDSGGQYNAKLCYSDSLNGSVTTTIVWTGTSSDATNYPGAGLTDIVYYQDRYMLSGFYRDGYQYYAAYGYSSSLTGWNKKTTLWKTSDGKLVPPEAGGINSMKVINGYCYAASSIIEGDYAYGIIAYTDGVTASWQNIVLFKSNSAKTDNICVTDVCEGTNGVMAVGKGMNSSNKVTTETYALNFNVFKLPSISLSDSAYTYIKALE